MLSGCLPLAEMQGGTILLKCGSLAGVVINKMFGVVSHVNQSMKVE